MSNSIGFFGTTSIGVVFGGLADVGGIRGRRGRERDSRNCREGGFGGKDIAKGNEKGVEVVYSTKSGSKKLINFFERISGTGATLFIVPMAGRSFVDRRSSRPRENALFQSFR
jgi:hypothetical protein